MRILFLTQFCPYPPTNGGAIKTFNTLKHLAASHDVRLLLFLRSEGEADRLNGLRGLCESLDYRVLPKSASADARWAARCFITGESFIISRFSDPGMSALVADAVREHAPDLIYVDHLQMAQYVPDQRPCPIVLDEHNVEWEIVRRFSRTDPSPVRRLFAAREWRALRSYEIAACRRADLVTTVTEGDMDTLSAHGVERSKVRVVPIGVDVERTRPVKLVERSRTALSFGTMSWPPNVDSVLYFADEIHPRVKRFVPDATFTIVGGGAPPSVGRLPERDGSIRIAGFVDDLSVEASTAAAFVVPLRAGSGMRVKILDAMALGLPIVTTSIGCEGISLRSGRDALIADSPDSFADATIRLMLDPVERRRLGASARRLAETRYAWPLTLSRLDSALESLGRRG